VSFAAGLTSPSNPTVSTPVSVREGTLALAVIALAFALRIWLISTVGLEHYDEGVYAISGLGLADEAQTPRLYPGQSRFSPLVYPLLVAGSFRLLGGASDIAAILPNVLLGTLSVCLLWWVGRRWFGPVAGLAAATLLATSELHIAMSRSALTDVGFTLFFLAAMACFVEANDRDSLVWALLAGLVTGLAWNTKYHGWFAFIPTGAALLVLTVQNRCRDWPRPWRLWAASAIVAGALYVPWALFVSSEPGGYAGLLAYQRSMLQGGWPGNLAEQITQLAYMDGATSRAGFAAAILIPLVAFSRRRRLSRSLCAWLLAALVGLLFLGAVGVATGLTLFWLFGQARQAPRYAGLVLACWVVLWCVVAPLYTPYLRLLLPFAVAVFAGAGACLQMILGSETETTFKTPRRPTLVLGVGMAVGLLAALLGLRSPVAPWRPATDFRVASSRIATLVPEGASVIVIGHPEIAFYLRLAGLHAVSPETEPEEWASETSPVYLVEGVYARRAPKLRDGLTAVRGRLQVLERYPVVPKDLRVLDDSKGQKAREYSRAPDSRFGLTLYLLRPVGS
jgi:4-amino-4-deoxy-L-arabinose transferase-like glycosyltransferase